MKTYRLDISSWTASFRYPNLISGLQPTLEVPPLSTVLGLINAAAGQYLEHEALEIGYYFEFAAKEVDLETIYMIEAGKKGQGSNSAKSNVIQREFLFETRLSLYCSNRKIVDYFRTPVYPLLLGRSSDLATVEQISEVELVEMEKANKIRGQIVPLKGNYLPGVIQALPKYFTNTFPRQNIGTEPYSVIRFNNFDLATKISAFRDNSLQKDGVDIYFHHFKLQDYVVSHLSQI
ncbi:MAG: type I-B CRISPR-associated protein Cas5b [Haliscomenobacter sp.]|uniref:type I-B CRISPR-associated protein Cas5b n=1 Tax=Haliscomenobacter sp. TaxID=2717303 RepID=UPI0029B7CDE7|nr:type I-B CRISPR-associated protein Cas5b [Haliscomenobacter sp.]MDX2067388.1 type I-B CRISPR-associated protein Cas5b [Haliscomenobacter sp.]